MPWWKKGKKDKHDKHAKRPGPSSAQNTLDREATSDGQAAGALTPKESPHHSATSTPTANRSRAASTAADVTHTLERNKSTQGVDVMISYSHQNRAFMRKLQGW